MILLDGSHLKMSEPAKQASLFRWQESYLDLSVTLNLHKIFHQLSRLPVFDGLSITAFLNRGVDVVISDAQCSHLGACGCRFDITLRGFMTGDHKVTMSFVNDLYPGFHQRGVRNLLLAWCRQIMSTFWLQTHADRICSSNSLRKFPSLENRLSSQSRFLEMAACMPEVPSDVFHLLNQAVEIQMGVGNPLAWGRKTLPISAIKKFNKLKKWIYPKVASGRFKVVIAQKYADKVGMMAVEPDPNYSTLIGVEHKIHSVHLTQRMPSLFNRLGQPIEDMVLHQISTGKYSVVIIPAFQLKDQVWITISFKRGGYCSFPLHLASLWCRSPKWKTSGTDLFWDEDGLPWRDPISYDGIPEFEPPPMEEMEYDSDRGQSYHTDREDSEAGQHESAQEAVLYHLHKMRLREFHDEELDGMSESEDVVDLREARLHEEVDFQGFYNDNLPPGRLYGDDVIPVHDPVDYESEEMPELEEMDLSEAEHLCFQQGEPELDDQGQAKVKESWW